MGIYDSGTILLLSPIGIPFYSARGISQTLTPIKEVGGNRQNLPRTINGQLINLTPSIFLKYSTVITGKDQSGPSRDLVWPGTLITVSCVATLSYPTGQAGSPGRGIVDGSSVAANGFTIYQPILNCMVINFDDKLEEWEHEYSWKLELEEV